MGLELTPLLRATAADAATFFAAVDPERLVEAVRKASDDDSTRSGSDNVRGRARAGMVIRGHLVVLGAEASRFAASDIIRRRFLWSEFLLQAWFMTRSRSCPRAWWPSRSG
jgi:hypothetical protein